MVFRPCSFLFCRFLRNQAWWCPSIKTTSPHLNLLLRGYTPLRHQLSRALLRKGRTESYYSISSSRSLPSMMVQRDQWPNSQQTDIDTAPPPRGDEGGSKFNLEKGKAAFHLDQAIRAFSFFFPPCTSSDWSWFFIFPSLPSACAVTAAWYYFIPGQMKGKQNTVEKRSHRSLSSHARDPWPSPPSLLLGGGPSMVSLAPGSDLTLSIPLSRGEKLDLA
ncbi:hypothetical protein ASPZODRAFT_1245681 [Penicilliopsis zonata CBS 506.65]|uniref:Uncharacterized protein n=1 Tax=Penicilliopsis zonata CBS 506.65 TaxID=1073090 RepID=A0A1L9S731_9EURO|nr:hypothetical protein ASPZODRAFT_1245681 [Penicilliopsis zonata CBS 506.65]OJJ42966.1 hypothetical protein ASPZODRAFT_1245681 [Penicilliopsis zonata CBS 506.65]